MERYTTESSLPKGLVKKLQKTLPYTSLMERVLLLIFGLVLTGATLLMLWRINERFLVTVPAHGGELVEGIVGTPRFINPVLALTDADKDLSYIVYSGLMKISASGLTPDLAERFEVSPDGKTYTFYIREDAVFHDGQPVTSDDVAYTINLIKDPLIKSPRESSWNDVSVTVIDPHTIQFTLDKPYTPFLDNTTIGILPKHLWSVLSPEQFSLSRNNIAPIGSGPYKIVAVEEDKSGIPEQYTLHAFKDYIGGEPYISTVITKFYTSEKHVLDAIHSGAINSADGISPSSLQGNTDDLRVETVTLPRVFGVFFNQNKNSIFSHAEVREALSLSIDRSLLIESVLSGFADPLDGPTLDDVEVKRGTDPIAAAQAVLEENGWEKNADGIYEKDSQVLRFTITTTDIPELKQAAQMIRDTWRLVGVDSDVEIFDTTALNQNVIRPREYEALLFGEVIGRARDLYPFWHSSGRNDPGLNIALYTNNRVDKLLETMRETTDMAKWEDAYNSVREEIIQDNPAIFLYAPQLVYIVPETIQNFSFAQVGTASERFATIDTWYMDTQQVWKIFAH